MRLVDIVQCWAEARSTRMRRVKSRTLAACLNSAGPDLPIVAAWLTGTLCQGKIGIGFDVLTRVKRTSTPPAEYPSLDVTDVNDCFSTIAGLGGTESKTARATTLAAVYDRGTAAERLFLLELLSGELRRATQEGVLLDAIARGADIPAARVQRAYMVTGDLPLVAITAIRGGESALQHFHIELFRPLRPMLASPAETAAEALILLDGDAFIDTKLDGVRVQIHRDGHQVRVYTRQLEDVTGKVPEVAQAARSFPWDQFVLDGEALAMRRDGTPHPYAVSQKRFGRDIDVGALRIQHPLQLFVFDALLLDGEECIDWRASRRFAALDALPAANKVDRIRVQNADQAYAFYQGALEAGHEGIIAKAPSGQYSAGARARSWLKIKPTHTVDLVVLAAEWGTGRRAGKLSNLHLAARDSDGGFIPLCETFRGLTDELLVWQTEALQRLQVDQHAQRITVRPELVVEVAFNDVQLTTRHPSGVSLRFARVKRYRPDKSAAEADTLDAVKGLVSP